MIMGTKNVSGKEMLDKIDWSILKSDKNLADFKESIELLDSGELIEIRRRLNKIQETDKVKIQLYDWHIGQPLTRSAYGAICARYSSIIDAPVDILKDPICVDKGGKPTLKCRNPMGMHYQKPTFQTILVIMGVVGIELPLQKAYVRALSAIEQSQIEYIDAVECGIAIEVSKAESAQLSAKKVFTSVICQIINASVVTT